MAVTVCTLDRVTVPLDNPIRLPLDTCVSNPNDDVTGAWTFAAPTMCTWVDPAPAPATIDTASPPDEVTVAIALDVPTTFTKGVPDIWISPDEAERTVGVPEICTSPLEADSTVTVPLIWTRPEDTLTMGTLNPGALDHGLVAAVDVTVGVPEIWTNPLDALRTVTVPLIWMRPLEAETNGRLNPGALDHGLVAAVDVTVPLVMVTGPVAVTVI
mgnify:CR=1 FL=1